MRKAIVGHLTWVNRHERSRLLRAFILGVMPLPILAFAVVSTVRRMWFAEVVGWSVFALALLVVYGGTGLPGSAVVMRRTRRVVIALLRRLGIVVRAGTAPPRE